MKIVPDNIEAFLKFDDVVSDHTVIKEKVREIVLPCLSNEEKAKAIFEWVRDHIPHTKDIDGEIVTCAAITTLWPNLPSIPNPD